MGIGDRGLFQNDSRQIRNEPREHSVENSSFRRDFDRYRNDAVEWFCQPFCSRPSPITQAARNKTYVACAPPRELKRARNVRIWSRGSLGSMFDDSEIVMGRRELYGQLHPFGISPDDLRQHLYVIGKSGSGKTTLLRNLILQLIEAGRVGLIDPHGDLAQDILDHIPRHRIEDVVLPRSCGRGVSHRFERAADLWTAAFGRSGIVGAVKSIWAESWGPRLEYILYAALAALIECDNVSLLESNGCFPTGGIGTGW